ncbi:MAG: DUF998 domain-containing protein [Treponema sp.]|jgi:hypothetical protein|nr:DUF998 domain-containing protein [Treponema sp.]
MKQYNIAESYLRLRQTLGVLGILLPWADLLCGVVFGQGNPYHWNDSISSTYYANSGIVFTGVMTAVGLFLITYRGYDLGDRITCTISGFFGLALAVFPDDCPEGRLWNLFMLHKEVTNTVHDISALIFFLSLIYMIVFRFTKGDTSDPKKARRNVIYRVCGSAMALSFLAFIVCTALRIAPWNMLFYSEAIALFFFGTAWLVKGETFKKLGL